MEGVRKVFWVLALFAWVGLSSGLSFAQDQSQQEQQGDQERTGKKQERYQLPDLEVTGEKQTSPIQEERSEPASVSVVPKSSIRTFGGPAQVNPYAALNKLLPSVNSDSMDAYGLTNDANIRIRGQSAFTFGSLSQTINGVPIGIATGYGASGNFVDMPCFKGIVRGHPPSAPQVSHSNLRRFLPSITSGTLGRHEKK